jgi:hypothetical protein
MECDRVKLNIKNRSQIVLLAPQFDDLPFQNVITDRTRHHRLLSNAQQLRGKTYVRDSAINPWDLSPQGRHVQPADNASWHVLMVDHNEQVTGCLRYRKHRRDVAFSELSLAKAAVSNSCNYGGLVRDAVQAQIWTAVQRQLAYVELGGWAISEALRFSGDAVRMVLMVYALAELTGGALAVTTATRRHNSASILKRMGGRPLSADGLELPPYFDPRYGCEMELLEFDSTAPNPQFRSLIDGHRDASSNLPVILSDHRAQRSSAAHLESSHLTGRLVGGLQGPQQQGKWAYLN